MKKAFPPAVILALLLSFCFAFSALAAEQGGEPSQNAWPDNKFTQLVTKPNLAVASVDVDNYGGGGSCKIVFADATATQLKAYAQTLQADGFKFHVEEFEDMTGAFSFRAGNVEKGEGFMVVLAPMSSAGAYISLLPLQHSNKMPTQG